MAEATVTSKGQITVPKDVRDALDLAEGDKVLIEPFEGRAMIIPIRATPVDELVGILQVDIPVEPSKARDTVKEALAADYKHLTSDQ